MGAICCQNQVYKQEQFMQHCLTFASQDFKPYFTSIQQEEFNSGHEPKTESKQYIQGSWKKEKSKTGQGVIFMPEQFYYEGQIVEGVANGQGRIIWPSRYSYKGAIQNNKAEGYGELLLADKNVSLKGNWVRGFPKLNDKMELNKQGRHGSITFVDETGTKKEQEFYRDTLTVKVEFGNGAVYEGEIKQRNNVYRIEGKGTMKYPDESYYIGEFVAGRMHGNGKYYWSNSGNWFEGEYKANFRDGRGTYYYNHQQFEVGEWKGGILVKEHPNPHDTKSTINHEPMV